MSPKILVFAGSIRTGSHNARLAALAAKELALAGADVTRISLEDFPLPLRPVITTSLLRGIETSMFLRLCTLAPNISRLSCSSILTNR